MKDLTTKQALAEATKRWGKSAAVEGASKYRCEKLGIPYRLAGRCTQWVHHPKDCPGGKPTFKVGAIALGMFFEIRGMGYTFREAFADVDRLAAVERARWCRRKQHHSEGSICGMCHYRGPPGLEGSAQVIGDALKATGS
jgi:hypothetical protein